MTRGFVVKLLIVWLHKRGSILFQLKDFQCCKACDLDSRIFVFIEYILQSTCFFVTFF